MIMRSKLGMVWIYTSVTPIVVCTQMQKLYVEPQYKCKIFVFIMFNRLLCKQAQPPQLIWLWCLGIKFVKTEACNNHVELSPVKLCCRMFLWRAQFCFCSKQLIYVRSVKTKHLFVLELLLGPVAPLSQWNNLSRFLSFTVVTSTGMLLNFKYIKIHFVMKSCVMTRRFVWRDLN
jgi:hypothetical protein